METHGKRNSITVHEQPHLYNWIRAVFLGETVFPERMNDFSGHSIDVFLVFLFNLKVEIRAVVVAHREIAGDQVVALFEQVGDEPIEVTCKNIHKTENVVVPYFRIFIIVCHMIPGFHFGAGE